MTIRELANQGIGDFAELVTRGEFTNSLIHQLTN